MSCHILFLTFDTNMLSRGFCLPLVGHSHRPLALPKAQHGCPAWAGQGRTNWSVYNVPAVECLHLPWIDCGLLGSKINPSFRLLSLSWGQIMRLRWVQERLSMFICLGWHAPASFPQLLSDAPSPPCRGDVLTWKPACDSSIHQPGDGGTCGDRWCPIC